jgi:ubiquinone/menaquinone biosynthesis C-methylase UbiE
MAPKACRKGKSTMSETQLFWDKIAPKYDNETKSYRELNEIMYKKIHQYSNKMFNVLDCGCGTGTITIEIAKCVKTVTAMDISNEMLKIVKAKAEKSEIENIEYKQSDLVGLNIGSNSFNTIFMNNVIHLVDEKEKTIRKAYDLLANDGYLISTTPCTGENYGIKNKIESVLFVGYLLFMFGIKALKIYKQVYDFKKKELIELILSCGFQIIETEEVKSPENHLIIVGKKVV